MNINHKIEQLRSNLVNDINNSGLPAGVIFYILKDVLNDLSMAYQQSLQTLQENNEEEEEDGH